MNDEAIVIVVKIVLVAWVANMVANLLTRVGLNRARKKGKWETDEQLLRRYKEIQKLAEGEGQSYKLWDELSQAIAYRDYKAKAKKLELATLWSPLGHGITQLVVIYFASVAYRANDIKLLILLVGIFLWRSLNHSAAMPTHFAALTLMKLHWAHPTAEHDFFSSEHCYEFPKGKENPRDRAFELLHTDGYFDGKQKQKSE